MGAPTFILELKHGANADGTRSVRIRIYKDGRKAYYNTGLKLLWSESPRKSEWNAAADYRKDNWITAKHPRYTRHNLELRSMLDALEAIGSEHPTFTAAQIKAHYTRGGVQEEAPLSGFFAYIEERIERKKRLNQFSGAENLRVSYRHLKEYSQGKADREMLKEDFLTDFAAHLSQQGYAGSTVRLYLNQLAGAYRKGVLQGAVPQAGDPFADVQVRFSRKKQPRPLPKDLLGLYGIEPVTPGQRMALNSLLLLFLLHGARVSEGVQLEWANITRTTVSYWPSKAGAKMKHVPRGPMLNRLLSDFPQGGRFVLPYLKEADTRLPKEELRTVLRKITSSINEALTRLCQRHGLAHLSTHMARRAFTDASVTAMDLHEAQGLLGHRSIQTTEHYASDMETEKLKQASERVYGGYRLGEHKGNTEGL